MTRRSVYQEYTTIKNGCADNNRASKYMKQKLRIQRTNRIIPIIPGDFNTPLSAFNRLPPTPPAIFSKVIEDMNNPVSHLDLSIFIEHYMQ